jgi:DNA-binding transcriptional LysR family regulator
MEYNEFMATLNYKHLRYFWMVAKSGAIARAGEQLHLTPQAISGQLRELEDALGGGVVPSGRVAASRSPTPAGAS